jgi:hypothetical protein
MAAQWTDEVEEYVARFIGFPLTYDTVLLRPSRIDRKKDKEVCDVLFMLRRQGISVELKSQHEDAQRGILELHGWCAKKAREGAEALNGATRTIATQSFSCRHLRRGLVSFEAGTVSTLHALVVLEIEDDCVILPTDLPERTKTGVPLTYLSTNDFLNIVHELRAFPDIVAYLGARLMLPLAARRVIGHERLLFRHYLLNDGSFASCESAEAAQRFFAEHRQEWATRIRWKEAVDLYAQLVEHVSDSLAHRLPNWQDGLDPDALAMVPPDDRCEPLVLQEELCDLPLGARRRLGRAFALVYEKAADAAGDRVTIFAPVPDVKDDFVYVVLSARGLERSEVIRRARHALVSALAHFGVERGMAIADRDGEGFEFAYGAGLDSVARDAAKTAGKQLFARVSIKPFNVDTLPRDADAHAAEAIRLARRLGWQRNEH